MLDGLLRLATLSIADPTPTTVQMERAEANRKRAVELLAASSNAKRQCQNDKSSSTISDHPNSVGFALCSNTDSGQPSLFTDSTTIVEDTRKRALELQGAGDQPHERVKRCCQSSTKCTAAGTDDEVSVCAAITENTDLHLAYLENMKTGDLCLVAQVPPLERVPVKADGDCLFTSLKIMAGISDSVFAIRDNCVSVMASSHADYEPFYLSDKYGSLR